jgi:single-stranded DNA-binding protein
VALYAPPTVTLWRTSAEAEIANRQINQTGCGSSCIGSHFIEDLGEAMNGIEACFEGRLAADPELRTSKAGRAWLSCRVAVGEGDTVQWIKVAVFAKAEELAGQLTKGSRVYCEAALRVETWTDKDGHERWGLSAGCWRCEPLGLIGRNRPAKPKGGPRAPSDAAAENGRHGATSARRDWQRPCDARPAS